jgi:hypothetical protein
MANKPEASMNPSIRTRVVASELAQQPVLAANVVSIAQEIGGFVATFYSVPSDALEAPRVKEQIQRQRENPAGGYIDVTIEAEPAAKLFLPITTVVGLVQLLNDNLHAWNESYARELRGFLDSAKAAAPAPAGPKKDG